MYVYKYYYDCKYLTQMEDTQGWWDEHWLLPEDSKKAIVFLAIALFNFITIIGPVVSTLIYLGWLFLARRKRNIKYQSDVYRWVKMPVFKEYVIKRGYDPRNHSGWTHNSKVNDELNKLLNAIKLVYGNKAEEA